MRPNSKDETVKADLEDDIDRRASFLGTGHFSFLSGADEETVK